MQTSTQSLLWIGVTLVAYWTTLQLYKKSRAHPLMLPVLTGTAIVVVLLKLTATPYDVYLRAISPLLLLIGPATVALALPLYGQITKLKAIWFPIAVSLVVGSVVGIISALGIAWMLGASPALLASLAPKSTTMPIATGLTEQFNGIVPLSAAAVAITGIVATMFSGPLLKWVLGTVDERVVGFSLGLAAHAIGTSRALQISETAGAYAAVGMGLNGLLTSILMPLLMFSLPLGA